MAFLSGIQKIWHERLRFAPVTLPRLNFANPLNWWQALHEKFPARFKRSEFRITLMAALAGAVAGLCVSIMSQIVLFAHHVIFLVNSHTGISGTQAITPLRTFLGPALGGIVFGLSLLLHSKWRARLPVDPIEANALHGGRMSVRDSLAVAGQNIISNGCGASVGLEAGYTQIGAGFASNIGRYFQVRRSDLRILVGCGAAGAIAAAFDAPLAGAAYAFELVIGVYTIPALAPVAVAAFMGDMVAKGLSHPPFVVAVSIQNISFANYPLAIVLGALCALVGIILMRLVTFVEQSVRQPWLPPLARPILGGCAVGSFGLYSTQVLSAGHGALHLLRDIPQTGLVLATILVLKCFASAVSIGTGFRGGLFFASLFIGGLLGKLFAIGLATAGFMPDEAMSLFIVTGMASMAAAVIGAPLTMIVLALEVTGVLSLTGVVMLSVLVASLTTREFFGYSFATWRFHLRGESIRSAQDVGWIRSLTVDTLMWRDVPMAACAMRLADFRTAFPLGSFRQVVALGEDQSYAGLIDVARAHGSELDELSEVLVMDDLTALPHEKLLPKMTAREAADLFDHANTDLLAVVESQEQPKVIGLLSEAYMLRRYAAELERSRREALGEAVEG